MTPADDEFYIGYESAMPPGIGRRVRVAVLAAVALGLAIAGIGASVQRPLADSSFAFGQVQTWRGYLMRSPAPAILVPTDGGYDRVWLVGRGKHGPGSVLPSDDGWVTVRGSQIERDPWRMVEVLDVEPLSNAPALRPPASLRSSPGTDVRIRGEIVDSKCYLGVMNPGERTVHRDCAIRCLSGGVMPLVVFTDATGSHDLATLVGPDGPVPLETLAPLVGRPVDLAGRLFQVDDVLVFQLASVSGDRP